MSEENVAIVRSHIEAYRRHDASVALSLMDPHAVLDMNRIDGSDAIHGRQAIEEAANRYVGTFEDWTYEVERLTDLGSGTILAVVNETGRGKGSGAPVKRSFATLYTVIGGMIVRITTFHTELEALEAAGLSE